MASQQTTKVCGFQFVIVLEEESFHVSNFVLNSVELEIQTESAISSLQWPKVWRH